MSLINQMLQDLEKRQPGSENAPLSDVRAVPRFRRISYIWPLLLLLAIAAGVLAWQWMQSPPPSQPAPLAAPAPASMAAPVAEAAPVPEPQTGTLTKPAAETLAQTPAILVPSAPPVVPPIEPPREKHPAAQVALKKSTELAAVPKAVTAPIGKTAPPPAPATTPASQPPVPAAGTVAKQIRELTPQQSAENEYRKALALIQQGRVTEAMEGLNTALQLDPRHAAARQTLIGLLVEARRFGEAERRLQDGLTLDRAQPELAMALARLQVERGDIDAAVATLERSQSAAPERADYHAFMAALLQRKGRHPEAIEQYRQALRLTASAAWQMGLGISLQAENRLQEAREAFGRAKAANTLSPELQAFVDQRLKQLGP